MRRILFVFLMLVPVMVSEANTTESELLSSDPLLVSKADFVIVKKSDQKMTLTRNGRVLREYRISLGKNPVGHKQQEGDYRTPEGVYVLDFKNPDSEFYKAIHISYPNSLDRKNASRLGVDPGGDIMIHGQKNGYEEYTGVMQQMNWTDGCIAVKNSEMDEIWDAVEVGTLIRIQP